MNDLIAGQKIKIEDLLGISKKFSIEVITSSNIDVDISCFGLNANNHLPTEGDMVFYNNKISPAGDYVFSGTENVLGNKHSSTFDFDLSKTNPAKIEKISICATSDYELDKLQDFVLIIKDSNQTPIATFDVKQYMTKGNKALMLLDVYFKSGVWRFGANAQGFNGGLAALVIHFGQTVEGESAPVSAPTESKIDLKKRLVLEKVQKAEPKLLDLTKKSLIALEKNNLLDVKAQVCLVLDRSGSMNGRYKSGEVQRVVERIVPLALSFDDNGTMECWAFGEKPLRLDDVTIENVGDYVETVNGGWKNWKGYRGIGAEYNEEAPVIEEVLDFYRYNGIKNIPTYVVFISDGGVHSNRAIKNAIIKASEYPIFWQFVGIGGSSYGILEALDTMQGRVVDNCNFFSLDMLNSVSEEQLYQMLLNEFPDWLKIAKAKNIF